MTFSSVSRVGAAATNDAYKHGGWPMLLRKKMYNSGHFVEDAAVSQFADKAVKNLEVVQPWYGNNGLYIVGKGEVSHREPVAFIPAGSVVDTEKPWFSWLADKYKCGRFYTVGTKRIQGIDSQGILVVLSKLPDVTKWAVNHFVNSAAVSAERAKRLGISERNAGLDSGNKADGAPMGPKGEKLTMSKFDSGAKFLIDSGPAELNGRYVVVATKTTMPVTRSFPDRPSAIKVAYELNRKHPDALFLVCKIVGHTEMVPTFRGEDQ